MSRPLAAAPKKPPKTPDKVKQSEKNRQQYLKHREKRLEKIRAAYRAKSAAEILEKRWRDSARPSGHKDRNHARAAMSQAYVFWSNDEEVVRTYMAAALMTELTGEAYEVDHIVPLRSQLVCGLHAHTNLQVLKAGENRFKGAWAWPGMWPADWDAVEELQKRSDLSKIG